MTTQNDHQLRCVLQNVGAATYYAPFHVGAIVANNPRWSTTSASAYIDMDGFDHLYIEGTITAAGAATAVLTVWSDDGSGTWAWDETLGGFNSCTGGTAATYTGTAGATTAFHLHYDNAGAKRWHVRLVTSDNTAVASITFRQVKG